MTEELDLKPDLEEKLVIDTRKVQSQECGEANCIAALKSSGDDRTCFSYLKRLASTQGR